VRSVTFAVVGILWFAGEVICSRAHVIIGLRISLLLRRFSGANAS
jgi:hypothetical protein